MKKLITQNQALSFYGTIADNIEKYNSRQKVQTTSRDVPLYVDQIGRLRDLFEKILSSIEDHDVKSETRYGKKLEIILNNFAPENANVSKWIFDSWNKVNKSLHYWKLKEKGEIINYELRHYKLTLKNISEFISEYSGALVPEKISKFYIDTNTNKTSIRSAIPNVSTTAKPLVNSSRNQQTNIPLTPRQKELTSIPDTRLPILFVLDISLSMNAENRIEDLNKGVKYFFKSMETDEITSDSVELSIITFGHEVNNVLTFSSIERAKSTFNTFNLDATGKHTCLGEAMLKALEIAHDVKAEYSNSGISYHQPWIVLITDCDGQGIDEYKVVSAKVSERILTDKLVLFPIAVGFGNLEILKAFSPERDPLLLRNKKFGEFFDWLKENALFISRSRPDENKPLSSPKGWSSI